VAFGKFDRHVLTDELIQAVTTRALELVERDLAATVPDQEVPAGVARLDREIDALRAKAAEGGDGLLPSEDTMALIQRRLGTRARLLARRQVRGDANAGTLALEIPPATERVRDSMRRLRHTRNPGDVAGVRQALPAFIPSGKIVLAPNRDRTALVGSFLIDAAGYLAGIPTKIRAQINVRPRPELNARF
jgi:hypothetical protein